MRKGRYTHRSAMHNEEEEEEEEEEADAHKRDARAQGALSL